MHLIAQMGRLLAGTLAVAAVLGCDESRDGAAESGPRTHGLTEAQAAEVLATVGDTTITVGDLAERLAEQSPYLQARYQNPERRREFLDNMIRFELLADEAERRGYARLDEVVRARKQAMIEELMEAELADIQLSDVSEEDIRAFYEAHPEEFHQPAQIRASHVVVATAAEARAILADMAAHPGDAEHFRAIARERTLDETTRADAGDLRFFGAVGEGPPEPVRRAAFAIEAVGGVAPQPVRTEAGYHVVMLTAKRNALDRTLEDARRMIQHRLWRERREARADALIARLRTEAHIEEDPSVLAEVRLPEPPAVTAAPTGEPVAPAPAATPVATPTVRGRP